MNHDDAIAGQAAERYLLREMHDSESEEFEQHFFDCRVCADDVRDGLRMMESGRELVRGERDARAVPQRDNVVDLRARRRGIKQWIPAAAAAVLLAANAVPLVLRSAPPRLVIADAGKSLSAGTRGASDVPAVRKGAMEQLPFDIPTDPSFVKYILHAVDARGATIGEPVEKSPEQANNPFSLLPGSLPAGSYELVIEGVREDGNRSKITSYPFRVVP
ncbi:MAG: hypothetical protein JO197_07345 [Acidobacteria bacterium]|nr:hypothetical protein [Acidobacteriota bacterium]MBV9475795.1 hypothetical protein [Acidobacteriota bacterium]